MSRESASSLFSRLARRLFTPRAPRRRPLRRRAQLELVQLEERIVLDAVGPGGWWDDGHYDSYGNRVGVTVSLHNWGSGWLEVSGGGGSVSVSPGAPPSGGGPGEGEMTVPPEGGDDGSGGESEPPPPSYAFEVFGWAGDGSGDVTWSGSADSLYIRATGDVSSVSISGTVSIDAGYSVGNVSGLTVTVLAGTSIGNVSATESVWTVRASSGSVGTVTAAASVWQVTAGGSVGAISAGGDIRSVSARE